MSLLWGQPGTLHSSCSTRGRSSGSPQLLAPLLARLPARKRHRLDLAARCTRCAVCAAPLEPHGLSPAASAALSTRSNRAVRTTAAAATAAASSAVLEAPTDTERREETTHLPLFGRGGTSDLAALNEEVEHLLARIKNADNAEQPFQWPESLTAIDQERMEHSRHLLEEAFKREQPASTGRRPGEADGSHVLEEQSLKHDAFHAPVTQLAASLPHQEPERLSLEVSTPEPSSASRPPPAPLPQRKQHPRRARASAARVAELRTSSHSAWGKSIKPDPEEPQAAAPKRGRVPRGKGRTAGKKSEAKDQPFQIMFKDHNQLAHRLLSMDEEQQHGKVIVQCREHEQKFNELRESMARIPTMTEWAEACEADNFETFKELVTRGRNARAIFEQCNMRLVAKIAYGYIDRGLELEDLMSYGIAGLNRAIDRFDPGRGFKFSTYAHWWIRQVISRAVCDKGRIIRIPCHLHDLRSKAFKRMQTLSTDLKREPTTAELAESLGVSERKIEQLGRVFKASASLEAPTKTPKDEEGSMLFETLSIESGHDISSTESAMRDALDASLSTLDARERIVVRMRYGLDDGCPRTLEDIGKYFKVTRERVRQIEGKAFRKMSQPGRLKIAEADYVAP